MRVLHAHWRPSSPGGCLLFWAEVQPDGDTERTSRRHPFCADAGSQIRNYVLDQSRIKDLRTGVERSDTQKVLDGDLDEFVEASLKSGLEAGAKRIDA